MERSPIYRTARSGQSLIEVLIALAIGGVLITAAAIAIAGILRASLTIQKNQFASAAAQDLMDKLRSYGNGNWVNIYGLVRSPNAHYFFGLATSTYLPVRGEEGMMDGGTTYGLVGYWKFDEDPAVTSTATYDASGNANTGTFVGSPVRSSTTCAVANCLQFDGVTAAVTAGASTLYDTSAFSVSFWTRPIAIKAGGEGNNILVARDPGGTSGFRLGIRSNGAVVLWTTQSGGSLLAVSAGLLTTARFYHVVATFASNTAALYIDGQSSGGGSGTYVVPVGAIMTLNGGPAGTAPANDYLDEVRWYNRALTSDEVSRLYKSNILKRYFFIQDVCRTNDSSSSIAGTAPCGGGTSLDPSTEQVTVSVQWPVGATQGQLQIVDYLTRWRNAAFWQADWTGGSTSGIPVTQPTNQFVTSTNIDYSSVPGSIKIQGF